jgi:hypothetical protein
MNKMSWAIFSVKNMAEVNEFKLMAEAILPVMIDASISRTAKRKTLCEMVDNLSEDTFKHKEIAEQIIKIINMKEDVCKEYVDAEAQVNGILSWLPRMEKHRELLKSEVIKNRKRYGLKI